MGVAHLSGRVIEFKWTNDASTGSVLVPMEILSGSIVDEVAQESSYLPVGGNSSGTTVVRTITNHVVHGRTIRANLRAALLMSDNPWNEISDVQQDSGAGLIVAKRLGTANEVEQISISLNNGGTSTSDEFWEEQSHIFILPKITRMEHTFDTTTHQVFDISFVADGEYYEPNVVTGA